MTTFGILTLWFGSFAYAATAETTDWRRAFGMLASILVAILTVLQANGVVP